MIKKKKNESEKASLQPDYEGGERLTTLISKYYDLLQSIKLSI